MAQSLKQIKNRIRSIQSTKKVTNAMELISVTKLNKLDRQLVLVREYFVKLESLFFRLIRGRDELSNHEYLRQRDPLDPALLCVITSDSGLCGTYNHNIIDLAQDFISKNHKDNVKIIAVGKKAFTHFHKRGYPVIRSYIGMNGKYSQPVVDEITRILIDNFLNGGYCGAYLAYTHFETSFLLKPVLKKFLNLDCKSGEPVDYIFEPAMADIFNQLLERFLALKLKVAFLNAFTSEHAARTVSMKTATENAGELLHKLVLLRNKVRQANITREIMEIISSAEALKG